MFHYTDLGLECEQRQTQEDSKRDKQRLHDYDIIIERSDHSKRESLQECEGRQQDEIPWVAVAFPEEKTEID